MTKTCSVTMRRLNPNEIIPAGALHSEDGVYYLPLFNAEETVGQKAMNFTRGFYVVESIIDDSPVNFDDSLND